MDRRLAAALLLGLALLAWMLRPVDAPAPPAPELRVEAPFPGTPQPQARAADPPPRWLPDERAVEDAVDALAGALEAGTIRCPIPAALGDTLQVGLTNHRFTPAGLVATVDAPSGEARVSRAPPDADQFGADVAAWAAALKEAREPLGSVAWTGAEPGQEGACVWQELRWVEIRGRVAGSGPFLTARGRPGSVTGCGARAPVAADGSFTLRVAAQARCGVSFNTAGIAALETPIDARRDRADVVVPQLPQGDALDAVIDELDAQARQLEAEVAEYSDEADPYRDALSAGGLSSDAAQLLEAWRHGARAEAQARLERLRRAAGALERAQDRAEAP